MRKLEALVNPFEKSEANSPDNVSKVESVDEQVESVYAHHNKIHVKAERIKNLKLPALAPVQIMVLLRRFIQKQEVHPYTGRFVTKLIESSYKKGYDSFKFDVSGDYSINEIGFELTAKKEKPINITVMGDAGHWWAGSSEYCVYEFMNNVGYDLGSSSDNCTYIFHGKAESVSRLAKKCRFLTSNPKLYGELEKRLGLTKMDRMEMLLDPGRRKRSGNTIEFIGYSKKRRK